MTIATCPRCQDEVTIPQGAGEQSRVACPLCREEFLLLEVMQELPPALILLDGPVTTETGDEDAADEDAADDSATETVKIEITGLATGDETDFEDTAESESEDEPDSEDTSESNGEADSEDGSGSEEAAVGAFNFGDSVDSPTTGSSSIRPIRAVSRKSENPMWTMIKVVLGGMLAIPLAQLILWWLPGNWSRDPMKMGPKASQYVPFLVPKRYHVPDDDKPRSGKKKSRARVPDGGVPGGLLETQGRLVKGQGLERSWGTERSRERCVRESRGRWLG